MSGIPDWARSVLKTVIPESTRRRIRDRQARTEEARHFRRQLRANDVFIVGHPKSGNTLITYMLAVLLESKLGKRATLANLQQFVPALHAADDKISAYAGMPDPRMFRNEGPKFPELYPRTLYIVRDPRAVLVSYYHHCIHDTGDINWKLDDFVEEILAHGCIKRLEPYIVRWDQQVSGWLNRAKHQRVKFVKYEDLRNDRRKVLEAVLQFLEFACPEQEVAQAVERSSFANMRKEEELHGAEPYSGTKGERGFFVRRGKVDGWKDELSPAAIQRIETEFAPVMQELGYYPSQA